MDQAISQLIVAAGAEGHEARALSRLAERGSGEQGHRGVQAAERKSWNSTHRAGAHSSANRRGQPTPEGTMRPKAVAFDWGHTLMDERLDRDLPLETRPVHLMPGVLEVLPQMTLPLAVWANTALATERDVRAWLQRAGVDHLFQWVVTSVDAGVRKPAAGFFEYALARCGLEKGDVLFVGNQLNTDIAGAEAFGIQTVWLSGPAYRSDDDAPCDASPTYTIRTLHDLPSLAERLTASSEIDSAGR